MNGDEVIALRSLWGHMNYGVYLPRPTVIASEDWTAYVLAMTEALPASERLESPTEDDVLWSWPDGVAIVFAEPFEVEHTIISDNNGPVKPHHESQFVQGLWILEAKGGGVVYEDGTPADHMTHPVLWIGTEPDDLISGYWLPGMVLTSPLGGAVCDASRLLLSAVTALGHRLTRLDPPASRPERRRAERALPGPLRILQLASGASVARNDRSDVAWTKRWMVRGHWRLQPCGPGRTERKVIWIDPYIKGPDDKPFDARTTAWRS